MYQGKYTSNAAPQKAPKEKKSATRGTKLFYTIYLVSIAVIAIVIAVALFALNDWLVDFEASQPDTKGQQVFDSLFARPDWENIYTQANIPDSKFENAATYAAYMEQLCSGKALTYNKTSAGLTGGHKYLVKLDGSNIAAFTLQNHAESELAIPQWELDKVDLFVTRSQAVSIVSQPGNTVTVNGVTLDDSYIVRTTTTVAEDYLPEGVTGARTVTYYVDGLLTAPQVQLTGSENNTLQLHFDSDSSTYSEMLPDNREIGDAQYDMVVNASQAYCRHMIGAGSSLSTYFDTKSAVYKSITKNELWFGGYTGYNFSDIIVTNYYPYTDNLYSARVSLKLNVNRANGTVKQFDVDNTLFVEKKSGGSWKVVEMVNVEVQDQRAQVKLTFLQDGNLLGSQMVSDTADSLTLPTVTAPEGKVLTGWFQETVDDKGKTKMTLVFAPDESGNVELPAGYQLKPMVLHALFEIKEA